MSVPLVSSGNDKPVVFNKKFTPFVSSPDYSPLVQQVFYSTAGASVEYGVVEWGGFELGGISDGMVISTPIVYSINNTPLVN